MPKHQFTQKVPSRIWNFERIQDYATVLILDTTQHCWWAHIEKVEISVVIKNRDLSCVLLFWDWLWFSTSPAIGEQRASPGSQARAEGAQGQPDSGGPAGALLQRLAALLHRQHGSGKERDSVICQRGGKIQNQRSWREQIRLCRRSSLTYKC